MHAASMDSENNRISTQDKTGLCCCTCVTYFERQLTPLLPIPCVLIPHERSGPRSVSDFRKQPQKNNTVGVDCASFTWLTKSKHLGAGDRAMLKLVHLPFNGIR